MAKLSELKIRLKERLRIYKDSPSVVVTYADLAHFTEDALEVLNAEDEIGFGKEGNG